MVRLLLEHGPGAARTTGRPEKRRRTAATSARAVRKRGGHWGQIGKMFGRGNSTLGRAKLSARGQSFGLLNSTTGGLPPYLQAPGSSGERDAVESTQNGPQRIDKSSLRAQPPRKTEERSSDP